MYEKYLGSLRRRLSDNWPSSILIAIGVSFFLMSAAQCAYPWNSLPLYTSIDGVDVSGKSIADATDILNKNYDKLAIQLYFGDSKRAYRQPTPSDVGIDIDSKGQAGSQRYQWWMRLIPTSLWWAHFVAPQSAPDYTYDSNKISKYVKSELGEDCKVEPQNATVKYEDEELQVVPAIDGGSCEFDKVVQLLANAKPTLKNANLRITIDAKPAKVTDKMAGEFVSELSARTATGLSIDIGNSSVIITHPILLGWLDFTSDDEDGLMASVNTKRAQQFFDKNITPKLSAKAGTTYITTKDFAEISRKDGKSGQTLDVKATIAQVEKWLRGDADEVVAKIKTIAPNIIYTRKYSATDTGLAALLKHFAESHGGVYGIRMAELSGDRRHAGYNDTRIFETASTYKLYVAYGTLKKIEAGKWHWSDKNIHNGRDLAKCFDDMIVLSDNECAHALLDKIGYQSLTDQIHAIGLSNSSFMHSYIETTPADLAEYLGMLASGQILNSSSRNTLLSAMKRQVYRSGVPAGTSATVADKVGFLQGHISGLSGTIYLLHDAAIVYSPKGTYVLTVMTGGSSWGTIAELTKAIENWR